MFDFWHCFVFFVLFVATDKKFAKDDVVSIDQTVFCLHSILKTTKVITKPSKIYVKFVFYFCCKIIESVLAFSDDALRNLEDNQGEVLEILNGTTNSQNHKTRISKTHFRQLDYLFVNVFPYFCTFVLTGNMYKVQLQVKAPVPEGARACVLCTSLINFLVSKRTKQ